MNDTNSLHPNERLPVVAVFLGVAIAAGLGAADVAAAPCDLTPTSSDPLVLAEIQVWHGLCTHSTAFSGWFPDSRAYNSLDPDVIAAQIAAAKASGIDGFVIDWYGPGQAGLGNHGDREFMDAATAALFQAAENAGFCLAVLYDEGTLPRALCEPLPVCGTAECEPTPSSYQGRAEADLLYADQTYLSSPAYLKLQGKPALFVFPYPEVDPHLDWPPLRAALSREVTLLDQDPNPEDGVHDSAFDGFFAWVQPDSSGWDPAGEEWGEDYLHWFYRTMKGEPYASKIAVGGVWPGFDDSLVLWGPGGLPRFMSRAGGYVYDATWALAACHEAEIVMIATWNDFEEGTDVEFGVHMGVDMDDPLPEVLVRSAPLEVTWTNAGEDALQVYENGVLVYDESHLPPVTIPSESVPVALESGHAYEIKVWTSGVEFLSQAVKIRRQDVDSGLFMNDGFESGNLCRWSFSAGAAP